MFPICAEDAFCAPRPIGVPSDASHAGPGHVVVVPVPIQDHAIEVKVVVEPALQAEDANEDALKDVKCPVDRPTLVARSASPLLRHC